MKFNLGNINFCIMSGKYHISVQNMFMIYDIAHDQKTKHNTQQTKQYIKYDTKVVFTANMIYF